MHIAISFDHNYLNPFYALISSIFDNNSDVYIEFHCIIKDDVTADQLAEINEYIIKNGCVLNQYKVDENLLSQFVISGTWTTAVYYKMFFPLLVPDKVEKLIYLDTDMLVVGNLKSIFEINIDSYALGAVYDNYVKNQPEIGIIEENKYFNSGMLLFNVPRWNELKLSEQAIAFLAQYPEKIKFVDQCALNAVCVGHWLKLPVKYNLLYSYIPQDISSKELNEFIKDKIVIHFTLQRPWNYLCTNRFRDLYKYYLLNSTLSNNSNIIDFSIAKIPSFIRIRIKEFYFDNKFIQKIWRSFNIFLVSK